MGAAGIVLLLARPSGGYALITDVVQLKRNNVLRHGNRRWKPRVK